MSPWLRVNGWGWFFGLGVGLAAGCGSLVAAATEPAAIEIASAQVFTGQRQQALVAVQTRLDGAQQAWAQMLADAGLVYQPVQVAVRRQATAATNVQAVASELPASPCPEHSDWGGLRYCPPERKVLVDMRYLDQWAQQATDVGDDARAYVLAHVLAHHVQNLLGVTDKLAQWQLGHSRRWRQDLHVRVELQADCLAGIWFQRTAVHDWVNGQGVAATMQRVARWHHDDVQGGGAHVGSMLSVGGQALHEKWFQRGLTGAGVEDCDTFIDEQL